MFQVTYIALPLLAFALGLLVCHFLGWVVPRPWNPSATESIVFRFCPNCSAQLEKREFEGQLKSACPRCAYVHWNNPITVGVMVIPYGDDGVVLVKRGLNPRKGYWALPAGFGDPCEAVADTAQRESLEEATLDVEIDRLLAVTDAAPHVNQVLIFYLAKPVTELPKPGSDATEAKVFKFDELPELAFPDHEKVLQAWIAGIRNTSTMA